MLVYNKKRAKTSNFSKNTIDIHTHSVLWTSMNQNERPFKNAVCETKNSGQQGERVVAILIICTHTFFTLSFVF